MMNTCTQPELEAARIEQEKLSGKEPLTRKILRAV